MEFTLPKKVKIAGLTYYVLSDYPFPPHNADLAGQIAPDDLEIRLSTKEPEVESLYFWHEVLHAIDIHYNNDKLDEEVIMRLAHGIHQVLKDNEMYNVKRRGNGRSKAKG